MRSQHTSKSGEPLHGLREALLEQDVEVAIDIEWRVLQLLSLSLRSGDHRLIGRKPTTMREWLVRNRERVLEVD